MPAAHRRPDQAAQDLFDVLPANFLRLHFDQGVAVFLLPISRFGHDILPRRKL